MLLLRKLLLVVIRGLDYAAMLVCFLLPLVLLYALFYGAVETLRVLGRGLADAWRHDRELSYVVLASIAWCTLRWKALTKRGPEPPIFETDRAQRWGKGALLLLVSAGCAAVAIVLILSAVERPGVESVGGSILWVVFCGTAINAAYKSFRAID